MEGKQIGELVVRIKADSSELVAVFDDVGRRVDELTAKFEELRAVAGDCMKHDGGEIRQQLAILMPEMAAEIKEGIEAEITKGGIASRIVGKRT